MRRRVRGIWVRREITRTGPGDDVVRGRVMTANAWKHMGLDAPRDIAERQANLFEDEG